MKILASKRATALAVLGFAYLLSSCASHRQMAGYGPDPDPDRDPYLYPRQYYNSLNPWERAEFERRSYEAFGDVEKKR